jgi:hypothetical protein
VFCFEVSGDIVKRSHYTPCRRLGEGGIVLLILDLGITAGYGLDDREIQVRSPAKAKDFSSNL